MKGPEAIGEFVLDHFCASDGGTIVENRNGLLVHRRVPSVVPQQTADGSCVFLRANGECAIHPVSPYGCSHFDTHMSQEQAEPRSRDMLLACEASPGYNALWRMLAGAGKIAKPVQERKDAMYEAELRVRTGT
jgi:Fe-S-cluster containining protein